ncbi:MAG: Crp/Fnr family transcriptional regulator, partial [Pseudomonadota bacterium]
LSAGDFLGEMSIINDRPRSATATVVEDAKMLVVDAKIFENMLRANMEIAIRLVKKLASRLAETSRQVEALLHPDGIGRVISYLCHLAEFEGVRVDAGIEVQTSDEELAKRLGLKAQQVRKILEELEHQDLLLPGESESFVVPDIDGLAEVLLGGGKIEPGTRSEEP